jgi:phytoene synthase
MAISRGEAYEACLTTLKSTDIDRYLACLLMPEEKRGAVAALYAFNAELARIRDIIHEPLPGEIRLQWWRDVLEGGGEGDSMANPLAAGLIYAITEHSLPRAALIAMTEARIFDLYDDPMGDTAMFEGYAGETASTLIQLAAMILDPANSQKLADAAGHAGIAQLTAGCLLLLPLHTRRRQVYIPQSILSATGLNPGALLKGEDSSRIEAALAAFIGFGRDHLAKARAAAKGKLTAETNLAFLGVSLADGVFDRACKAGAGLMTRSIQPSQLARQWRFWRASRRQIF